MSWSCSYASDGWDWGGEEAFGGLGTANLSSQIWYLQTMDSQEQFRVLQLGWHKYSNAYSTAWKPLFIPVDSLGRLHSEFKHYIQGLKLNREKTFPYLWIMPHHIKNLFFQPQGPAGTKLSEIQPSAAPGLGSRVCPERLRTCEHLFVCSYLLCMWKPEPLHGHAGATSDIW